MHDAVALADRRRVTDGVHLRVRHRPQRGVGDDTAALVDGQTRGGRQRRDPRAAGPQDDTGRDALPAGQLDRVGQHLHHLDPAAHPHTQPVERGPQVRPGLRVHGRTGLVPAQQHDVEFRVPLGDLRGRLDAGQPAAGDHDRTAAEPGEPVGQHLGIVGAVQGVRVVLDTRHGRRVGHAAQPVDQRVVVQHPVVVDPHGLAGVDRRHPARSSPRRSRRTGKISRIRRAPVPEHVGAAEAFGEPVLRLTSVIRTSSRPRRLTASAIVVPMPCLPRRSRSRRHGSFSLLISLLTR